MQLCVSREGSWGLGAGSNGSQLRVHTPRSGRNGPLFSGRPKPPRQTRDNNGRCHLWSRSTAKAERKLPPCPSRLAIAHSGTVFATPSLTSNAASIHLAPSTSTKSPNTGATTLASTTASHSPKPPANATQSSQSPAQAARATASTGLPRGKTAAPLLVAPVFGDLVE